MSWLSRAVGRPIASTLGQVGMVAAGGPLWGAIGGSLLGGGGGGGQNDAVIAELQNRLNNPQGYSPEELNQMKQALVGAVSQQRDQQIENLRSQMIQSGTFDSGAFQQQAGRISSGYADALARGVAGIMASSQEAKRASFSQTLPYLMQGLQLQQQGS